MATINGTSNLIVLSMKNLQNPCFEALKKVVENPEM